MSIHGIPALIGAIISTIGVTTLNSNYSTRIDRIESDLLFGRSVG